MDRLINIIGEKKKIDNSSLMNYKKTLLMKKKNII
jgi:hypothetical protein